MAPAALAHVSGKLRKTHPASPELHAAFRNRSNRMAPCARRILLCYRNGYPRSSRSWAAHACSLLVTFESRKRSSADSLSRHAGMNLLAICCSVFIAAANLTSSAHARLPGACPRLVRKCQGTVGVAGLDTTTRRSGAVARSRHAQSPTRVLMRTHLPNEV